MDISKIDCCHIYLSIVHKTGRILYVKNDQSDLCPSARSKLEEYCLPGNRAMVFFNGRDPFKTITSEMKLIAKKLDLRIKIDNEIVGYTYLRHSNSIPSIAFMVPSGSWAGDSQYFFMNDCGRWILCGPEEIKVFCDRADQGNNYGIAGGWGGAMCVLGLGSTYLQNTDGEMKKDACRALVSMNPRMEERVIKISAPG